MYLCIYLTCHDAHEQWGNPATMAGAALLRKQAAPFASLCPLSVHSLLPPPDLSSTPLLALLSPTLPVSSAGLLTT